MSYAGLPADPCHRHMLTCAPKGVGAGLTFDLKGGYAARTAFVQTLKLFSHVANVGDMRSLVIHPASTNHKHFTDEQRTAAGAGPDVVRLPVGIESIADILADLEQAPARS